MWYIRLQALDAIVSAGRHTSQRATTRISELKKRIDFPAGQRLVESHTLPVVFVDILEVWRVLENMTIAAMNIKN